MNNTPRNHIEAVQHISPIAHSATATPTNGVDCEGYTHLVVIANVGAVGASATFDLALQQSSVVDGTGDTFAALSGLSPAGVADDGSFTQLVTGGANLIKIASVNLAFAKKFIRCVGTYGGSGTALVGVTFLLIGPRKTTLADNTYEFELSLSGNA